MVFWLFFLEQPNISLEMSFGACPADCLTVVQFNGLLLSLDSLRLYSQDSLIIAVSFHGSKIVVFFLVLNMCCIRKERKPAGPQTVFCLVCPLLGYLKEAKKETPLKNKH